MIMRGGDAPVGSGGAPVVYGDLRCNYCTVDELRSDAFCA